MELSLTVFETKKGSQTAVLMISSPVPEQIETYAVRVAEQWKLGDGALTDLTSKRIISETILPKFKQQDFYGGITAGVEQIIKVSSRKWHWICQQMEESFRLSNHETGVIGGLYAVKQHAAEHFPAGVTSRNELPDSPVVL